MLDHPVAMAQSDRSVSQFTQDDFDVVLNSALGQEGGS
jgi:hypothetical protein